MGYNSIYKPNPYYNYSRNPAYMNNIYAHVEGRASACMHVSEKKIWENN